jgi:hypothetical protein
VGSISTQMVLSDRFYPHDLMKTLIDKSGTQLGEEISGGRSEIKAASSNNTCVSSTESWSAACFQSSFSHGNVCQLSKVSMITSIEPFRDRLIGATLGSV